MTETELYRKVFNKFGLENQILKTIEEMAELTQALLKGMNEDFIGLCENIHEEIADVDIMMSQMKSIFDAEKIETYRKAKLERLEKLCGQ